MIKYNDVTEITTQIKHIMIDNKIKQKDIATKTGWTKQTISNLINNRTENIGINTLKELCNSLGYDLYIDFVKNEEQV